MADTPSGGWVAPPELTRYMARIPISDDDLFDVQAVQRAFNQHANGVTVHGTSVRIAPIGENPHTDGGMRGPRAVSGWVDEAQSIDTVHVARGGFTYPPPSAELEPGEAVVPLSSFPIASFEINLNQVPPEVIALLTGQEAPVEPAPVTLDIGTEVYVGGDRYRVARIVSQTEEGDGTALMLDDAQTYEETHQ